MDYPNFFDEECDYRYVTDCSVRNWVYHPYFVLYNNLDQDFKALYKCCIIFENVVVPLTLFFVTWLVTPKMAFRWGYKYVNVHAACVHVGVSAHYVSYFKLTN